MPQNVNQMLANATKALGDANSKFPSPKPAATAAPKPATAPKPAGIGEELKAKSDNVGMYATAPKMHNGGPVMKDGIYDLKAGEHVLTQPEATKARKHAMMAAGMKSMMKPGPKMSAKAAPKTAKTSGEPAVMDKAQKMPEKKTTTDIKVRPEKNQAAKIKQ